MKRLGIWLLLFCQIAIFIGCSQNQPRQALQEPPELTVVCGEREVTAFKGTYSWTIQGENGEMEGVIACGPHPLDVLDDLPVIAADAGEEIVLAFDGVPDKLQVGYYSAAVQAANAEYVQQSLSGGNVILLPEEYGGIVYEIQAKWETGGNEGSALYAFYVP